jgi:hypothetical protein
MRAHFIFGLLAVSLGEAQAGAWLPETGTGKLIVTQIDQKQQRQNIVHFRHRELYRSVLIEYGLTGHFGLATKAGRQSRFLPGRRREAYEARLGVMLDTPALAGGLLPPFTFRLAKAALPFKQIKREKRAGMILGLFNELDETWTAFASADRITIQQFRIMQEVEFDRIRGKGRDWRNWLYRFMLGYGAVDIGTEAHHFADHGGAYRALAHSYVVQWNPPQRAWQMRLKTGHRRAPMAGVVQKNDYLTLELEFAF